MPQALKAESYHSAIAGGPDEIQDESDSMKEEVTIQSAKIEESSERFTSMFSYVGTAGALAAIFSILAASWISLSGVNRKKTNLIELHADTTAYYCLPAAFEFRETVCGGDENIYAYIHWIAQAGAELLAKRLGTEVMDVEAPTNSDTSGARKPDDTFKSGHDASLIQRQEELQTRVGDIRKCAMANVRLPFIVTDDVSSGSMESTKTPIPIPSSSLVDVSSELTSRLIREYKVGVSIFPYKDRIWLRVSGQIYLELADFDRVADMLIEALEEIRARRLNMSNN